MIKKAKWIKGSLQLNKTEPTRFVFLNDVHAPDCIPLDPIFKFISDYKPHHTILGGDTSDLASFSHWEREVPRKARNMPYPNDEYKAANEALYLPLRQATGPKSTHTYIVGNHSARAYKAIDANPEGQGFWEPELNTHEIDQWVEQYGVINLGKLHFCHGDILQGSSKSAADRMLSLYRRSMRFGHFHCLSEASHTSPVDIKDRHTARCCGTLQNFQPQYMRNRPHAWIHAFTYGVVDPDGIFWDQTVKINKGTFYAEGKRYK